MKIKKRLIPFLISFFPILVVVIISRMLPTDANWYVKPSFQPPSWVFPIVWGLIYLLLGFAGGVIVKAKDWKSFIIYLINLALNLFWSILFFGLRLIGWAFIEILILWLSIIIMFVFFRKTSKLAAWLLVPYFLWVTFAAVLNLAIYIIN